MNFKDQIGELVRNINLSDDAYKKDDIESVESFIKDCGRYVEKVIAMEAALQISRFRLEAEEYRELIVRLDGSRRIAHEALIASTRLLNRLCKLYDVDKIYTGPIERIPIAEFAREITNIYFEERKL